MPMDNVGPGVPARTAEALKNTHPLSNGLHTYSAFHVIGQAAQLGCSLQLLLIALHQLGVL